MNPELLFHPNSIVHVGASSDFTKLSGRPLKFLLEAGFPGPIYPVNAGRQEIAGLKCYPSAKDVPGPVDLAIITLAAAAVPGALADCARIGVKAAVVISGGFAEIGGNGVKLQQELVEIATANGIAVCGPNCSGLVNPSDKLIITFSGAIERGMPLQGSIAMAGQSGALSTALLGAARDAHLGFTYWVSVGNEAVVNINDYVAYFLDDPQTRVVIGYLEEIRDGEQFKECAYQAIKADKPLVFIKVGRTASGAKAALSHTGALARPDELYMALFNQLGIVRAYTLDELLDYARIFSVGIRPKGKKTLVLTSSGGVGALISDACDDAGLEMVAVSAQMTERVSKALGPVASIINITNPIDFSAEILARPSLLKEVMSVMINDPDVDIMLIYLTFFQGGADYEVAKEIVSLAQENPDKLVAVAWFPSPGEATLRLLGEGGIPCFPEPVRATKAIAQLVNYSTFREEFLTKEGSARPQFQTRPAANIMSSVKAATGPCLDEVEAKNLFKQFGFTVPPGELTANEAEAIAVAVKIGYPVVLKVVAAEITHKSDVGGVKVGIGNEAELKVGFQDLLQRFAGYQTFRGILVEKMVTGGQEAILGMKVDPSLGAMVSFGLGGIFVEMLQDLVFLPVPFSRWQVEAKLRQTRAFKLLAGYRGGKVFDIEALIGDILRLGAVAAELKEKFTEIDINPLIILPEGEGTVIADALVIN